VYLLIAGWTDAVAACRSGRVEEVGATRVARLLWSSLHGIVAMSMAVPFAVSRERIQQTADDLLDLALAE
jgi:hypothetical protein